MVFRELGGLFDRLEELPLARAPRELLTAQPQLAYQVTRRLEGAGPTLLIGARTVAVTFTRPYEGWNAVRPTILHCIQAALATGMFGGVERCSIRYVNLLPVGADEHDLSQLKLKFGLGDFALRREGVMVRSEIERDGSITVVEIMSGATLSNSQGKFEPATGVLCNVDTIRFGPFEDFNRDLPMVLDEIHNTEKGVYFGLLTDETLNKLEPVWD